MHEGDGQGHEARDLVGSAKLLLDAGEAVARAIGKYQRMERRGVERVARRIPPQAFDRILQAQRGGRVDPGDGADLNEVGRRLDRRLGRVGDVGIEAR